MHRIRVWQFRRQLIPSCVNGPNFGSVLAVAAVFVKRTSRDAEH
jgi:hypothetical protein